MRTRVLPNFYNGVNHSMVSSNNRNTTFSQPECTVLKCYFKTFIIKYWLHVIKKLHYINTMSHALLLSRDFFLLQAMQLILKNHRIKTDNYLMISSVILIDLVDRVFNKTQHAYHVIMRFSFKSFSGMNNLVTMFIC